MTYQRPDIAPGPLIAALAASNVGTWEWRIGQDRVVSCTTTAALFGLEANEALQGAPLDRYVAAIHADDRDRTRRSIMEVRRNGGLFVAEYRTLPAPDDVRWVLARGRFEHDGEGEVTRARGIVIDVSESRHEGAIEGASFVAYEAGEGSAIDRITARAIQMHQLSRTLDPGRRARIKPILDLLLLVLGQQLGASLPEGSSAPDRNLH